MFKHLCMNKDTIASLPSFRIITSPYKKPVHLYEEEEAPCDCINCEYCEKGLTITYKYLFGALTDIHNQETVIIEIDSFIHDDIIEGVKDRGFSLENINLFWFAFYPMYNQIKVFATYGPYKDIYGLIPKLNSMLEFMTNPENR